MSLERLKGNYPHPSVSLYLKAGDTPESSDVLILLSHWPTQPINFDVTRLLGDGAGCHRLTFEGIDRPKESDCEGPRGPKASASRNVSQANQFDRRPYWMH